MLRDNSFHVENVSWSNIKLYNALATKRCDSTEFSFSFSLFWFGKCRQFELHRVFDKIHPDSEFGVCIPIDYWCGCRKNKNTKTRWWEGGLGFWHFLRSLISCGSNNSRPLTNWKWRKRRLLRKWGVIVRLRPLAHQTRMALDMTHQS